MWDGMIMTKQLCLRFYVSGRVQGVWFRASAQQEATRLGITGWAKNLPDGRVEVVACGDQDKLVILHEWLKHGPLLAKVEKVTQEELPWQSYEGFQTL
jgi:acylphosphatase